MRTLGVIGGMSWESTAVTYRLLNQGVAQRLGGLHSASLRLHSVDFAPVAAAQAAGDWDGLADVLAAAAQGLVRAGAQGLLLATNTMHRLVPAIEQAVPGVPLLHIADATGAALRAPACWARASRWRTAACCATGCRPRTACRPCCRHRPTARPCTA